MSAISKLAVQLQVQYDFSDSPIHIGFATLHSTERLCREAGIIQL